jgi:nitroreductase
MKHLNLTADELLTTTRAVRKRLDFDKAVEPEVISQCIEIALQAPTGGNTQGWHFVAVFDADKRQALADLYRKSWAGYRNSPGSVFDLAEKEPPGARKEQHARVCSSADYLADNLERVPVHVIPCIPGRLDRFSGPMATIGMASVMGSILPAVWSYMLAARERGLGTCWTTAHLAFEEAAAELLGIPYGKMSQVALIPTAYTIGDEFKTALRRDVSEILHIDQW